MKMQALQRLRDDLFTRSVEAPTPAGWWEHWLLWAGFAFASLLPFILSPLPPMADLFSHIGRYYVMMDGGHSEILRRYYAFNWTLIANLGQDLLVYALAPLMGVRNAAFFTTALIPAITILGIRQLSMAVHGRVHPGALMALPFAFAFPFLYGFVNYCLGIAVGLWVVALWFRWRAHLSPARIAALLVIGFLMWLIHMAAWAVVVVAVGSIELAAGLRAQGWRPVRVCWTAFLRVLPLAIIPTILTLLWRSGVPDVPSGYTLKLTLWLKSIWFAFILRDQSKILDLASVVFIAGMALWLLIKRNRIDPGMAIAALVLMVMFWALPITVFNSYFADLRLLAPFAIFVFVAFDSNRFTPRARNVFAVLAIALFAVRLGFTTWGWIDRGYALKDDLRALDHVGKGARIAVLTPLRMFESWDNSGVSHLPSLGIGTHQLFVNTEWNNAGSQLMRPIYNEGRGYNDDVSARLKMRPTGQGKTVQDWIHGLPRDRFDYVWLLKVDLPPNLRQGLVLKFRNRESALYAIQHQAPAPVK